MVAICRLAVTLHPRRKGSKQAGNNNVSEQASSTNQSLLQTSPELLAVFSGKYVGKGIVEQGVLQGWQVGVVGCGRRNWLDPYSMQRAAEPVYSACRIAVDTLQKWLLPAVSLESSLSCYHEGCPADNTHLTAAQNVVSLRQGRARSLKISSIFTRNRLRLTTRAFRGNS